MAFSSVNKGLSLVTFERLDVEDGGFNTWEGIETVEEFVLVGSLGDGWHGEELLLNVSDGFDGLGDERNFHVNDEFLNLIEGLFFSDGNLVWDKDLSRVALEELSNVWLLDGDGVWDLLPLGLLEDVLNLVSFLLVLGDSDLAGDDVWNLLDDGVVDSLGGFVWDGDFLLKWDLVVDGVWDLLGDDVWDLVGDSVWHLSGGGVGDLNLNFVWDLSLNGVWDLFGDLNWLKGLDFVLFGDVLSLGDLVWNLLDGHNWDLLGNLVLFGHVFSDSVDFGVIRGVSGGEFSIVTNLSPSVWVEATKSTAAESSSET